MRGFYNTTYKDRIEFYTFALQLVRKPQDLVDMESSQLCMSDCETILKEIGYYAINKETNGWEGDMTWKYSHPEAPDITVTADAYTASLKMQFSAIEDGKEVNATIFEELLRNWWKKKN